MWRGREHCSKNKNPVLNVPRTKSSTQSGMILWHINSSWCGGAESTVKNTKSNTFGGTELYSGTLNRSGSREHCSNRLVSLVDIIFTKSKSGTDDSTAQRIKSSTLWEIILWHIKQIWKQRTLSKDASPVPYLEMMRLTRNAIYSITHVPLSHLHRNQRLFSVTKQQGFCFCLRTAKLNSQCTASTQPTFPIKCN